MQKSTYNRQVNANANYPSLTKNTLYLKSFKKWHISFFSKFISFVPSKFSLLLQYPSWSFVNQKCQ
jgi:hypothetical protein